MGATTRRETSESSAFPPDQSELRSVFYPMAASAADDLSGLIEGQLMPNDLAHQGTVCIRREGLNAREIPRKGLNERSNLAN